MSKVDVNGPQSSQVFQHLKSSAPNRGADISWNFGAYWVVDATGQVVKRAEVAPAELSDELGNLISS